MGRFISRITVVMICAAVLLSPVFMSQLYAGYQSITRPVHDYGGILSGHDEKKITDLIVAHRGRTGVQIAVLTVPTTGKDSIEEYSLRTANQWGGGRSERNDGVLFTIAVIDRRMRLEVGKGLTGYIHDAEAQEILDGIRDDFRQRHFGKGVYTVIEKVIAETETLRPDQRIPFSRKLRGFLFFLTSYYLFYYLIGLYGASLFRYVRNVRKFRWITAIAGYLLIYLPVPVLLQLYYPGVYYWKPIVYLSGAFAGSTIATALLVKGLKEKIWAMALVIVPALVMAGSIFYNIDYLRPDPYGTTDNETILLIIVILLNFAQVLFWMGAEAIRNPEAFAGGSGGGSYGSGSSSGSSSGSDSGSTWSGGGGSFGGGGASSSW